MTEVVVTLDKMINILPRYGCGRSGQIYVKYDDVVSTIDCFFRMKEEVENKEKCDG